MLFDFFNDYNSNVIASTMVCELRGDVRRGGVVMVNT